MVGFDYHKKFSWKWVPMILFLFFTIIFVLFETIGLVTIDDMINWIKSSGQMAGLVIFLLLLIDIIIPVPSSVLIMFAGSIYGIFLGTFIGFTGSLGASFAGFFIMRRLRESVGKKLVGIEELGNMNIWFHKWGEIGLVLSRMIPMVTETMSFLAGLSKITWKRFFALTSFGALPMSIYYVYVGSISKSSVEWLTYLIIGFIIPATFWMIFQHFTQKKKPVKERS